MYVDPNDELWEALGGIARDEGLELYDAERNGAYGLRITIGKAASPEGVDLSSETQGGVTSGDCSRLCRRLMVYFAAKGEDFGFRPEPEIEVSSPGINRTLRLPAHFAGAVGQRIKLVVSLLDAPADKSSQRTVVGELRNVRDGSIEVLDEGKGECVELSLREVRRANVEFLLGKPAQGRLA